MHLHRHERDSFEELHKFDLCNFSTVECNVSTVEGFVVELRSAIGSNWFVTEWFGTTAKQCFAVLGKGSKAL